MQDTIEGGTSPLDEHTTARIESAFKKFPDGPDICTDLLRRLIEHRYHIRAGAVKLRLSILEMEQSLLSALFHTGVRLQLDSPESMNKLGTLINDDFIGRRLHEITQERHLVAVEYSLMKRCEKREMDAVKDELFENCQESFGYRHELSYPFTNGI